MKVEFRVIAETEEDKAHMRRMIEVIAPPLAVFVLWDVMIEVLRRNSITSAGAAVTGQVLRDLILTDPQGGPAARAKYNPPTRLGNAISGVSRVIDGYTAESPLRRVVANDIVRYYVEE